MDFDQFHDASIQSININGALIEVHFKLLAGEKVVISFQDTKKFVCNYLTESNVVLSINVIRNVKKSRSLLNKLYLIEDESRYDFIDKISSQITSGKMVLVEVAPSYGAEIIVLCKEFGAKPFNT